MPKKKWDEKGEKIQTYVPESQKVDLKIKLHHHGLTQAGFLRGVIKEFLTEDPQFMAWFDVWKLRNSKIKSSQRHAKSDKLKMKGQNVASKFGINEGELEDIFDVIAKEHPDL
tara:strand:+ start:5211 stop:5549 length:339 start_codon:yes stop_codon:yes gene_type:complete